jgi:hypothetical protein
MLRAESRHLRQPSRGRKVCSTLPLKLFGAKADIHAIDRDLSRLGLTRREVTSWHSEGFLSFDPNRARTGRQRVCVVRTVARLAWTVWPARVPRHRTDKRDRHPYRARRTHRPAYAIDHRGRFATGGDWCARGQRWSVFPAQVAGHDAILVCGRMICRPTAWSWCWSLLSPSWPHTFRRVERAGSSRCSHCDRTKRPGPRISFGVLQKCLTRPCLRPSSMLWCLSIAPSRLRQGLVRKVVEPRKQAGVEILRLSN